MKSYPTYLDHNATTPCHPTVLEAMMPYFGTHFGNASSSHHPYGWMAEEAVEMAREQVAELIGAQAKEIVFTSGATEAINLAIRGVAWANKAKGNHLITLETEHSAVLDTMKSLSKQGFEISYLPVNEDGLVSQELLKKTFRKTTILLAAMFANNETGLVLPVGEMAAMAKQNEVLFFTDGVQAVGKIPVDVREAGIDLMALSAHKMYGPKGVGALYLRKSQPHIALEPQITGGGQETGRRSGTLNVPGIVGLGKAAELALNEFQEDALRLSALRDELEEGLLQISGSEVNGSRKNRLPHVSNISFKGIPGKPFLLRINKGLAVSSGAACSSITDKPSHVLTSMGLDAETAMATLRFSLGKSTNSEDIAHAIDWVREVHRDLKQSSVSYS
ncbi:cysteine desulfurase family protein [Cyclobacterium plantarum]|uniref:cysteine desulfurase n=1 Tax=Cyclobacterium plantarum TaxID=2716263 RepID=A0ABX0HAK6_9BACT|nr:cysteine desulfurase family protein [Cyclobacterium plantarum]NHE57461.1 cysteine desulfurase [Cyclobacterium plantarum]